MMGVVVGVEDAGSVVVVIVVIDPRKRVCRTQRCRHDVNVVYDDPNGGELAWPPAFVVTEDERNGAILE